MKPAPFKYRAAESIEHALALKAEHGEEARFLAGGQSLVPTLNFRLAQPAMIIDINPLTGLAGIQRSDTGDVRVGALTRYRTLERDPVVADALPLVHEALPLIAHPQIRNRGTIGGNLSNADPSSELPAIVLALGGRLRVRSVKAERWIEARDFFVAALTTALEPDELLIDIELPPLGARTGCCFMEVSRRRGDFALMGVAAVVALNENDTCKAVRLALCGAGDTPVDVSKGAESLAGHSIDERAIDETAAAVRHMIDPPGSIHANAAFQRHLAGVLVKRALRVALDRARQKAGDE